MASSTVTHASRLRDRADTKRRIHDIKRWLAIQLQTERLSLRPHRADDWAAVGAYANHPGLLRYQPDDVRSPEQMQAHLQHLVAAQQREPRTSYHFAIILEANQRLIGWCGLSIKDRERQIAELGYDHDRTCWGMGYMTEAARAVIGWGFTTLKLHRIFAECHPANAASIRVMQKLGMTYEGHLRENVWVKGSW
ncbi:MAG: GNAT family N-acetyltransferase [Chloroflexota bacterium]|nr:GNAT family N-acetyltransferase [Chloroflexota bacterium]